jgi:hypothetical protein
VGHPSHVEAKAGIFSEACRIWPHLVHLLDAVRRRQYEGDLKDSIWFFVAMALAMLVVLLTELTMSRTGITNNYIIVLTEVAVVVLRVTSMLVAV